MKKTPKILKDFYTYSDLDDAVDDDIFMGGYDEKPKTIRRKKLVPLDSDFIKLDELHKSIANISYTVDQDTHDDIISKIVRLKESARNNVTALSNELLIIIHDLVNSGTSDFILLKHDLARDLYQQYRDIIDDIKTYTEDCAETEKLRKSALSKLTTKEKAALGILDQ